MQELDLIDFSNADNIQFDKNTQLLTDDELDIQDLVRQSHLLAKKHTDSLYMMTEYTPDTIKIR